MPQDSLFKNGENNQNIGEDILNDYEELCRWNIWNNYTILICECITKLRDGKNIKLIFNVSNVF